MDAGTHTYTHAAADEPRRRDGARDPTSVRSTHPSEPESPVGIELSGVHSPAAALALQRLVGNRAVARALAAQRVRHTPGVALQRLANTAPAWDAVHPDALEGTGVHVAQLGKAPYPTVGSGPLHQAGFVPYERQQLFSAATAGAEYCEGHLLNDNLGGPGNRADNLTAFPQKPTNMDHLHLAEAGLKSSTAAGQWYSYDVDVTYSPGDTGHLLKKLGKGMTVADGQWLHATYPATGLADAAGQIKDTFWYASYLVAQWQQLDATSGATIGAKESATANIPSPLSFVGDPAKQAAMYPGLTGSAALPYHIPKFKQPMNWNRSVPKVTAKYGSMSSGRPYSEPKTWEGIDDARYNKVDSARRAAEPYYDRRVTNYKRGADELSSGSAVRRWGRSHSFGQQDYIDGMDAARDDPTSTAPATVGGQRGHREYLEGVDDAKADIASTVPLGKGRILGHTDYLSGATAASADITSAAPPRPAAAQGHADYLTGVTAARTPGAIAPTPPKGAAPKGHHDYLAGQAAAGLVPPGPVPAAGTAARAGYDDAIAAAAAAAAATAAAAAAGPPPVTADVTMTDVTMTDV